MDEAELKERQARAMADPEVQSILSDPIMRQVGRSLMERASSAARGAGWAGGCGCGGAGRPQRPHRRSACLARGAAAGGTGGCRATRAWSGVGRPLCPPYRRCWRTRGRACAPPPASHHPSPTNPPLHPDPPQVLADMQEDPAAAQQHLRHPDIARKIEKLVAAGILQVGVG